MQPIWINRLRFGPIAISLWLSACGPSSVSNSGNTDNPDIHGSSVVGDANSGDTTGDIDSNDAGTETTDTNEDNPGNTDSGNQEPGAADAGLADSGNDEPGDEAPVPTDAGIQAGGNDSGNMETDGMDAGELEGDNTAPGETLDLDAALGEVWPPAGARLSSWVYPDGEGGLGYQSTDTGDRIPDFSFAGYGGGGVAFPNAPIKQALDPQPSGDDTARIQAAIDAVAALPLDGNGMRGTVLLRSGLYRIRGQLRIEESGIILRGQGRGSDGTVLRAKGTDRRSLIVLGGTGSPREIAETRQMITDAYVPVGSHHFHVADASGYQVGQRVIVERDSTREWLDRIGMDSCDSTGTVYDTSDVNERTCLEIPWLAGERNLEFDRVVTAVEGSRITVDAPLTMSFDAEFGGGWVYQFTYPGRIARSGIEKLRGESDFAFDEDEDHSWNFIEMSRIEDAWVDRIVARYFAYAAVLVGKWARRVTIEDSRCLDPVSIITGARRYSFKIERATQVLVQRCDTREGRHDFVLGQRTVGPNVFLQGTSVEAHADVGPHAGWSPGALFDGIVTNHDLNIRNRGNMGTNHGWVSAFSVVWNSEADEMKMESPPGAKNWCIGCVSSSRSGNAVWESEQNPVWPESLYLAQLRRRLGEVALQAIGAVE